MIVYLDNFCLFNYRSWKPVSVQIKYSAGGVTALQYSVFTILSLYYLLLVLLPALSSNTVCLRTLSLNCSVYFIETVIPVYFSIFPCIEPRRHCSSSLGYHLLWENSCLLSFFSTLTRPQVPVGHVLHTSHRAYCVLGSPAPESWDMLHLQAWQQVWHGHWVQVWPDMYMGPAQEAHYWRDSGKAVWRPDPPSSQVQDLIPFVFSFSNRLASALFSQRSH